MAIKKDDLDKLKTTLKGIDVDKMIAAAIATDEQPFEVPADLNVLTTAELTQRDSNVTATASKAAEAIGETKGKELAAKAFRKKFNLADTIGNDIDKVVEAVNTELAKGDEGLKVQIGKLQADKSQLEKDVTNANQKAIEFADDMELIGMFPVNRAEGLSDTERLMILKNQIEVVKAADGTKTYKNKKDGTMYEDPSTHAPLPGSKVMETIFTERKWTGDAAGGGDAGGRGGGNQSGAGGTGGLKTFSKYKEKWIADNPGKNAVSPEFDNDLAKHTKDMTDFDYDN